MPRTKKGRQKRPVFARATSITYKKTQKCHPLMPLSVTGNPFVLLHRPLSFNPENQIRTKNPELVVLSDSDSQRVASNIKIGDDTTVILISDNEEGRDKENTAPTTEPLFSADSRPLGFIPPENNFCHRLSFEQDIIRQKVYAPIWLVRPGSHHGKGFRRSNSSACWLEDSLRDPRLSVVENRKKDIDALPRWFGPLNYTTIYHNHDRVPRNSLEFFKLCFQPIDDGDMEVWIKYRDIEEEIWVNKWDHRRTFQKFLGDLHGIAFGQKEDAATRVRQMEKAIRLFWNDDRVNPREMTEYYRLATAKDGETTEGLEVV